ncbi:MAG: hypothetical protein M0011_02975 [Elusimicrobia bacterium]|nr:hypothetical protein [Elusimicrobiota bacterium]
MKLGDLWIRKDREEYFLTGLIICCSIAGFVSSYWHFTDRISVRQKIKLHTRIQNAAEDRKLRDTQFAPSRLRSGTTQYYHLDEGVMPAMPKLGDHE